MLWEVTERVSHGDKENDKAQEKTKYIKTPHHRVGETDNSSSFDSWSWS